MPADNLKDYKKGDRVNVRYAGSNPGVTRTDTVTVEEVKGDFILSDSGYNYHKGTILGRAAPVEGTAASPEMQRLVTLLYDRASEIGPDADCIESDAAEEKLLTAIASLESIINALTIERDDNQRQLLIAEGVTEKLDDNNAALRAENDSLKRVGWSVLDGFPRHLDCQCGLCKLRDALASLPPTEKEI